MMTLRPSQERGHLNFGWLDTYHTFSFGEYFDPAHRGFRTLRVINEDRVAPGQGFGTHPHADMEIITYILEGELEHRDSMGNGSVIKPGDVQRMSAGTGITHSEFNPSEKKPVHLLQIWIFPDKKEIKPSYEQKHFPDEEKQNRLCLIASSDGREGSVQIHQDALVYASLVDKGNSVQHVLKPGRGAWIHLVRGSVTVNGKSLKAGDAVGVDDEESSVSIVADSQAEILLFDLA